MKKLYLLLLFSASIIHSSLATFSLVPNKQTNFSISRSNHQLHQFRYNSFASSVYRWTPIKFTSFALPLCNSSVVLDVKTGSLVHPLVEAGPIYDKTGDSIITDFIDTDNDTVSFYVSNIFFHNQNDEGISSLTFELDYGQDGVYEKVATIVVNRKSLIDKVSDRGDLVLTDTLYFPENTKTNIRISCDSDIEFSQIHISPIGITSGTRNTTTNTPPEANSEREINAYPNPSGEDGIVSLKGIDNIYGLSYSLSDLSGSVLKSGTLDQDYLDLSDLNTGMYLLNIETYQQRKIMVR
ncbi:MAG: T9SS type A sorting domain-containing protein [Cyclobacteriaceae bacterium]